MLRDFWYTACAASRLRSIPLATRVLDADLVLFRDASDTPHALLDRCCHRGVPLSQGKVLDGAIVCAYHGWRYDGGGKCVHVPSLTASGGIPPAAMVPARPCAEQDGYVWVWMGDAPPTACPRLSEFALHRWRQGSLPMRCEAIKAIENNLDWCHPYFAHPWTHGQFFHTRFRGFTEQHYEMRTTDRGVTVFAPVTGSGEQPPPERPIVQLTFELPDRVCVEFWRPVRFIIQMHVVPTGPNTCRLEWLATRLLPLGRHVSWTNHEPRILRQDRRLLESAQPTYDRGGGAFEVSVAADASTLLVRRIIGLASEGRWPQERASLPARRIVTVRA